VTILNCFTDSNKDVLNPFFYPKRKGAIEATTMATEKSIELFLGIFQPELKTLRLSRSLFHLPVQLNNFIHPSRFCGFSRIPNRLEGGMFYYVESSLA
jgi:hypothetical protein